MNDRGGTGQREGSGATDRVSLLASTLLLGAATSGALEHWNTGVPRVAPIIPWQIELMHLPVDAIRR